MTASNHEKVLKQIGHKPGKVAKWKKHNTPKKRVGDAKRCIRCGRRKAHVSKYGLHLCRQCFREIALELGFNKYD